jgi:phage FluMu gp28-like protein
MKITGYTWTSANKTPAYENLRAKIFDHKILFNKKYKDLIISDFNNVHRIVSESGKISYEAGRNNNGHSDVTSAIVLALESISKTKVNEQVPVPILHSSVFGNRRSRL